MDLVSANLLILKNQLIIMQMALLNSTTPRLSGNQFFHQEKLIKQIEETKEAIKTIKSR